MGKVLWFTGLSGSGKSTLANALHTTLKKIEKSAYLLDGDEVRKMHGHKHGFSRDDIRENNRLIAEYAKEKAASNDFVLVSVISPFLEDRARSRQIIGEGYIEVFIDCPLEVCIARDTKGLYAKAKAGEKDDLIGMSDKNPYEKPINPEITIKTNEVSIEQGIEKLTEFLSL